MHRAGFFPVISVVVVAVASIDARASGGAAGRSATDWSVAGGALRGDRRLAALVRELDEARLEGLRRVEERCGLRPGALPIEWRLVDRPVGPGAASAGGHVDVYAGGRGFHAGETVVDATRVVVTIPAHRYLARPRKVRRVVVHEAAHAVLASRLASAERYAAVPEWLREGIALWVSGEGSERVDSRVAIALLAGSPPASFLRGLDKHPMPAEAWLAFRSIETRVGTERTRRFVAAIGDGAPAESAIAEALGLHAGEAARWIRRDVERAVDELLFPGDARRVTSALAARVEGRPADAARELESLAERDRQRDGRRPLATTFRYLLAGVLLESGQVSEAREALVALLPEDREVFWEPEILARLAECERRLNRPQRAVRYWNEVLERFPEDREVSARARAELARAHPGDAGEE